MTLEEIDAELAKLPPAVRKAALEVGRTFGSDLTLAQAQATLNAQGKHGAKITAILPKQVERLRWLRDALIVAKQGRSGTEIGKKVAAEQVTAALREGKSVRLTDRSIIESGLVELRSDASEAAATAITEAMVVLERTSSAGANVVTLAAQLDELRKVLEGSVGRAAEAAGTTSAITKTKAAADKLRALDAQAAQPRGTPVDTERLDVLDGEIVALCRHFRRCARAAGRAGNESALASAYELTDLYGRPAKPTSGPSNEPK